MTALLAELLGSATDHRLSGPPPWSTHIADDHTPVEYSVSFEDKKAPTLRVMVETIAPVPGIGTNTAAAEQLLSSLAVRFGLCLDRFDRIRDLFLNNPRGRFGLWFSAIFRPGSPPRFKAYFDPEAAGPDMAPALVSEALSRLGLHQAYALVADHALRRAGQDRLSFFSLDLHRDAASRVKVYVSHDDAGVRSALLAAAAVPSANPDLVRAFCALLGEGISVFGGRPLISSYTFTEANAAAPATYSLYLPIRAFVPDDQTARDRVRALLDRHGIDRSVFDRALAEVSDRELRDGVGLIPHVALRTGTVRPGITVYLSAEAYSTTPARARFDQLAHA
ncbi:MAG: tryptophan dimethylallyltransferase [Kutzneria sp.]|nr:tryptophan dimethylallyltransferase [Kutzneria sp.]